MRDLFDDEELDLTEFEARLDEALHPPARDPLSLRLERCLTASSAVAELMDALRVSFEPLPGTTEEGDRRYAHADLAGMSERQLWQEERRAEFLLTWLDDPSPWIASRYRAVRAEQRRRGGMA